LSRKENLTLLEWFAIIGGALGAFMAILDIQVTNASLREISGALSLDMTESGWISTAYLIAEIIVIPLTAYFSSVYGIRRYLLFNTVGFVAASILCGLSWNLGSLVLFRVMQGFTGGTLIPLSFQLILLLMPERQKPLGMTIFGLTVTLAPTLGPSIGGWLTDNAGWRSIFVINTLPGIIMFFLVSYGLAKSEVHTEEEEGVKTLDKVSLVSLVFGLGGLTYILEDGPKHEWFDDFSIRVGFISSLIFLPIFIVRQFTGKNPLLRLDLLRDRNFAIGTIVTALAGCALFSGIYSLSLYLAQVQDYSAPQIGKILMWVGLPQLLVMPMIPFLMKFIDLRVLAVFGLGLFSFSNYLNTFLNLHYGGEQLVSSLAIRAMGQPLFVIPLSMMAMGTIQKSQAAAASSIFNVMRNLGASFGIALTTTFLVNRQSLHLIQKAESYSGSDFALLEKLYQTDRQLRQSGLDAATAHHQTFASVLKDPLRDSLIMSFSDVFWVLFWALIACAILVIFLKRVDPADSESGESF
jgi:MFS transporter, DHA2 family, multidrug resistance protein